MFDKWLNLDEVDAQTLLSALSEGCRRYLAGYPCGGFSDEAQTLLDLTEQYPGDTGVLAALLLNRMTLNPGEGIYLDAGTCTPMCVAQAWKSWPTPTMYYVAG